jgi:NAD(P)-dependent dehydrogenase (short-subunit alcohol dehydrogenase family)
MTPLAMDLRGKVAVITGGAGGIGAAVARAMAAAGARVVISDRQTLACEATAAAMRAEGAEVRAFGLDVTDTLAVRDFAAKVGKTLGDADVLVNNAGILVRRGIDDPEAEAIARQVMDVNLHGAFAVARAFLPALRRTRGNIVNIASGAAFVAQRHCAGYSASKGALRLLTQTMAVDLGVDGVRVNAVAPGVIETPMTQATLGDAARLGSFLQRIPAGRVGQPGEIAAAVLFLASPLASYVNGVTLPVDGGFLAG